MLRTLPLPSVPLLNLMWYSSSSTKREDPGIIPRTGRTMKERAQVPIIKKYEAITRFRCSAERYWREREVGVIWRGYLELVRGRMGLFGT